MYIKYVHLQYMYVRINTYDLYLKFEWILVNLPPFYPLNLFICHNFPVPIQCTSANEHPVYPPNSLIHHIFSKSGFQWINEDSLYARIVCMCLHVYSCVCRHILVWSWSGVINVCVHCVHARTYVGVVCVCVCMWYCAWACASTWWTCLRTYLQDSCTPCNVIQHTHTLTVVAWPVFGSLLSAKTPLWLWLLWSNRTHPNRGVVCKISPDTILSMQDSIHRHILRDTGHSPYTYGCL